MNEVRLAFRALRGRPALTGAAIATLALGIGVTTAVFSVVEAVMLRPLPYERADRLTLLWNRSEEPGARRIRIYAGDLVDYRERSRLFEGFAAAGSVDDGALEGPTGPTHVRVGRATPNLLPLLGVEAALGRRFAPEDLVAEPALDAPADSAFGSVPVMLSHRLWRQGFGGDPGIVGRSIRLNGVPATVVGVLPSDFELLLPPDVGIPVDIDLWVPLDPHGVRAQRERFLRDQDSDVGVAVIGRLRPGVTLEQARAEMAAIASWQRESSDFHARAGLRIAVQPMHADAVRHVRPLLVALLGAVGLVLLLAAVNVSGLLLARALERRREMAVLIALGATRRRIVGRLLIESAGLALLGALAGLIVARWGIDLLVVMAPADLPRLEGAGINGPVLRVALGVTLAAALVSALAPAVKLARASGASELRGSTGATAPVTQRLRGALVISEVALSLVLLVGTGLMLRTAINLNQADPGFEPRGVLTFEISLRDRSKYRGPGDRARFARELEERIMALPGVEAVGLVSGLPLSGRVWSVPYGREATPPSAWGERQATFRTVSPGYFEALGARMLTGRSFTEQENTVEERRVVVVDELMAQSLWPEANPIGRRLSFPLDGRPVSAEVVGVVNHIRYHDLRSAGRETLYVPYRHEASRDVAVAVRVSGEPASRADELRRAIRQLDPGLPVYNLRPLNDYVSAAMAPTRFSLALLGCFAGLAVALALVGLYGVLSSSVGSRGREIAVRMALGARDLRIVGMILREGLALVGAGIVAGALLSLAASRALGGLLFGVPARDPLTLGFVAVLLGFVALWACVLPARRAARTEPMEALRHE